MELSSQTVYKICSKNKYIHPRFCSYNILENKFGDNMRELWDILDGNPFGG